jgi:hypothetical protein
MTGPSWKPLAAIPKLQPGVLLFGPVTLSPIAEGKVRTSGQSQVLSGGLALGASGCVRPVELGALLLAKPTERHPSTTQFGAVTATEGWALYSHVEASPVLHPAWQAGPREPLAG